MAWQDPEAGYERKMRALAILNAWVNEPGGARPGGRPLWLETLFSYLEEDVDEAEVVIGFVELAGTLLVKLEKAGHDPQAVLEDIARRYRPEATDG